MDFKNFLDELNTLHDERGETIVRIKSHELPVILYGAGLLAKRITKKLTADGCEVAGYAVDDEYFMPNQTYLQRPVHRMADLIAHPNDYVFVLGVGVFNDNDRVTKLLNEHKITLYMLAEDNMALIDAEYILSERDKFSETFGMFADDFSRQTMLAYLRLKVSGNPLHCAAICKDGEYFNDLTATALRDAVGRGLLLGLRGLSRRHCGALH